MRIVILAEHAGGRLDETAGALTEDGHEVMVLAPAPGPVASLLRARRHDPDAVHAAGPSVLGRASAAAVLCGARLVYDADPAADRRSAPRRAERVLLGRSSLVIASSAGQARALRAALGLAIMPVAARDHEAGHDVAPARDSAMVALYQRLPGIDAELRREAQPRARRRIPRVFSGMRRGLREGFGSTPWVRYARTWRLRASGRYEDAAAVLERIRRSHPADPFVLRDLAGTYRDLRRDADARACYRELLEIVDWRTDPLATHAASMLARLGARSQAQDVLRHLEGLARPGAEQLVRAAELRVALDDLAGARGLALEAGGTGELQGPAEQTRIRVLETCGEPTAAVRAARAAGEATIARRLEGMLRALDPAWRPRIDGAGLDGPPRAGRVLHLLEASLPHVTTGYAYRTRSVLEGQRRAGLNPVAATRLGFPVNRGVRDFAPVEVVGGAVHHRYALRGVTRYSGFPHDELAQRHAALIAPLVRELRPAFVQAATPYFNGLVGHAVASAHGLPFVYDVRGFPEMTWATKAGGSSSELYGLRREAETSLMAAAEAVLTLSGVMRDAIVARGIDEVRVRVVPHLVDTDRMRPRKPDSDLVHRYGLDGATVVGYLGSLTEYEGLDVLLRAVAGAAGEDPSLKLLIVGDGPARPSLEALAERLEISDRVIFAGRIPHDEAVAHYSLYDLFVLPRRGWEVCRCVTPLKPFEAMAMGLCLLTSDVPALAEATGWGEWGATFAAEDPEDLASSLLSLAADPQERARLGHAARAAAVERHGATATSTAIRDMLEALDLPRADGAPLPGRAETPTVR